MTPKYTNICLVEILSFKHSRIPRTFNNLSIYISSVPEWHYKNISFDCSSFYCSLQVLCFFTNWRFMVTLYQTSISAPFFQQHLLTLWAVSTKASADPMGISQTEMTLQNCPKIGQGYQAFLSPHEFILDMSYSWRRGWNSFLQCRAIPLKDWQQRTVNQQHSYPLGK